MNGLLTKLNLLHIAAMLLMMHYDIVFYSDNTRYM
jgi:hypothetical protein